MQVPTFATFAAQPDAAGAFVLIPSLDGRTRRHGPCFGYQPHPDGYDAARDDLAVVVEDNDRRIWILSWERK